MPFAILSVRFEKCFSCLLGSLNVPQAELMNETPSPVEEEEQEKVDAKARGSESVKPEFYKY